MNNILILFFQIALPKSISTKSIAWNKTHGYIACGGDNGILKVLKLESRKCYLLKILFKK